jgi:ABC-type branched-subunit amino acid transport system ATPase component
MQLKRPWKVRGAFDFKMNAIRLITYHMALVKELFPRTIIMDEGQIVADGLTMEILDDEKLLEAHGLERG